MQSASRAASSCACRFSTNITSYVASLPTFPIVPIPIIALMVVFLLVDPSSLLHGKQQHCLDCDIG